MLTRLFFILALFCFGNSNAQSPYFQQQVNNTIDVTLDDEKHVLHGKIYMEYKNNSSQTLDYIYIHLWANAYKNNQTAFGKQQIQTGHTDFYFANQEDRGYIDSILFTVDGKPVAWELDKDNIDIAKVYLPKGLVSGKSVVLQTPFRVKIPKVFSRLGHKGQNYNITQWFPKPAVYDATGWHAMPYLDQGEFYSEFGNYDVAITLPSAYVVASTGVLQDVAEQKWLKSNKILQDSATISTKTMYYKAANVHDFAWFADKEFVIKESKATLPSGKIIPLYVYFVPNNNTSFMKSQSYAKSVEYVAKAVEFYSKEVGEYPYPQATAVIGNLEAGGGMEYPMVTIIDKKAYSEDVVVHEVGHNWFYGILASNERDFAWIDEGFNSYIEKKYTMQQDSSAPIKVSIKLSSVYSMDYLIYLHQQRTFHSQATETTSNKLSPVNYYLAGYLVPPLYFHSIEKYLGEEKMRVIMHDFYTTWQFKHPQPNDIKAIFEKNTGKDFSWLFQDIFQKNKNIDYDLLDVIRDNKGAKIVVSNITGVKAPIRITGSNEKDSIIYEKWIDGVDGTDTISLETEIYAPKINIDASPFTMPEVKRNNNYEYQPVRVKIKPVIENPAYKTVYFLPLVGWNTHDKLMLGGAIYNTTIPHKTTEFVFAPLWSFRTQSLSGYLDIVHHYKPRIKAFQKASISLYYKSFSYGYYVNPAQEKQFFRYYKIQPSLRYEFQHTNPIVQSNVSIKLPIIVSEYPKSRVIQVVSYEWKKETAISSLAIRGELLAEKYVLLQGNAQVPKKTAQYIKSSLEIKSRYMYANKRNVYVRVFAGKFLSNSNASFGLFPFALASKSINDYYYTNELLYRSDITSQQVISQDGGFRVPVGTFMSNSSNAFMAATNISVEIPRLPRFLKLYADAGIYKKTFALEAGSSVPFCWSVGISIEPWKDVLAIHLPVANSSNVNQSLQTRGNYFKRIGITLQLDKLYPPTFIDENAEKLVR